MENENGRYLIQYDKNRIIVIVIVINIIVIVINIIVIVINIIVIVQ